MNYSSRLPAMRIDRAVHAVNQIDRMLARSNRQHALFPHALFPHALFVHKPSPQRSDM
jgi:hypothetical protein